MPFERELIQFVQINFFKIQAGRWLMDF